MSDATTNHNQELDDLITAFVSPMPNQNVILSDYEARRKVALRDDSPELEPPMIREFAIHILQTIHFL